jgi:cytosine/adenosine deaminase-related metal-dependent hydrolase
MITEIDGSYIVAYDGEEHRLLRDGVVVYEDDRLIHVGKAYGGSVDRRIDAKGKLVCPGFINIHAITSICITHFRIDGVGTGGSHRNREMMLEGIKNPKTHLEGRDLQTSAKFCFAELIKGGATTIGEITAFGSSGLQPPREQAETFVKTAGEMGARAYISHPYVDMKKYRDEDESLYHYEEELGRRALDEAVKFCEENEGVYDDRVRTMLFPYMFDACSEDLLRETKRIALEKDIPIHMHTAQYLPEFYESLRRYGKTPVHFLNDIGFLGPKTILTHLLYTSLNPVSPAPNTVIRNPRDIEMLARSGTTLGHTPLVWGRVGLALESYTKFMDAGVNIAIGTDAFPMDMIMEMRYAAVMGKVVERHRAAVTARDVFNAATLGGARALGRDDLGRLSTGAKADILIVDLTGIHTALTHDPIKNLVYFCSQKDIKDVIVDGETLVADGKLLGIDEEKLAHEADMVNKKWVKETGVKYPLSFREYDE